MRSIIVAIVAALVLAGCSSTNNATAPPAPAAATTAQATTPAEPHTEAAVRAAANEEFDSYASGDYGGAWDMFYAPAKKLISRDNYLRLFELCPSAGQGLRFTIEKITMDGADEARVRTNRAVYLATYQFRYEDGHWRFVPTADNMRDYRTKTVQQMVSERRAQGACGS